MRLHKDVLEAKNNRQRVIQYLKHHGPADSESCAKRTGVSKGYVSHVFYELEYAGDAHVISWFLKSGDIGPWCKVVKYGHGVSVEKSQDNPHRTYKRRIAEKPIRPGDVQKIKRTSAASAKPVETKAVRSVFDLGS